MIDAVCLTAVLASLVLVHLWSGHEWVRTSNFIYILLVTAYFTWFEIARNGKTIGKWVVGIRRVALHDVRISLEVALKRITLALLIPVWILASVDLLSQLRFIGSQYFLAVGMWAITFVATLWPLSVILTKGQSSVYDVLCRTGVQLDGLITSMPRSQFGWRKLILCALIAALIGLPIASAFQDMINFSSEEWGTSPRLSEKAELMFVNYEGRVPFRIPNYYALLRDDPRVYLHDWRDSVDAYSFSNSVLAEIAPAELPDSAWNIALRLDILIEVTKRGMHSDLFQTVIESEMLNRASEFIPDGYRGFIGVVFTYRYSSAFFNVLISCEDRTIAMLHSDGSKDLELMWIREPDAPVSLTTGFFGTNWWSSDLKSIYLRGLEF
jgi:uncharacterized RDD family membrane protein YckC